MIHINLFFSIILVITIILLSIMTYRFLPDGACLTCCDLCPLDKEEEKKRKKEEKLY